MNEDLMDKPDKIGFDSLLLYQCHLKNYSTRKTENTLSS